MPSSQDAKRHRACNAQVYAKHFAALSALVLEYGLDDERIWNLDESECTPRKDTKGAKREKRLTRRGSLKDRRVAEFVNCHRMTMMPSISAAGDVGPVLYVFQGVQMPYRTVVENGHVRVETLANHLPKNSLVTTRKKIGGVDGSKFYEWAKALVEDVRPLTAGGRKLLLTYDGYRSHMTLRVLELFRDNGIVVYALPAHTSEKTQPIDASLFGSFKVKLNEIISECATIETLATYTVYDFLKMLRHAYYATFTRANVMATFKKAGMWPVNRRKLMSVPVHRSADDVATILTVAQLDELYKAERLVARRRILGEEVVITKQGFVDITSGAVLTSDAAIAMAAEKSRRDAERLAVLGGATTRLNRWIF